MECGRRRVLFSEVNDRIFELLSSAEPDLPAEFLCECGHECGRRIELPLADFAALRRKGGAVRSRDCARPSLFRRSREHVASVVPVLG